MCRNVGALRAPPDPAGEHSFCGPGVGGMSHCNVIRLDSWTKSSHQSWQLISLREKFSQESSIKLLDSLWFKSDPPYIFLTSK